MKKWLVLNEAGYGIRDMGYGEILDILLENRGIKTVKEKEEFLNPPNPYTLTAGRLGIDQKEVGKAVDRIKKAISSKEKIIVYGDYDSDGVCATAILWETLWNLGAKVMPFIPTRDEGYGMKVEKLDDFIKDGVTLVITVDQGIVAYDQAEHAREIGLDLIITDHHLLGVKKPKATAIIHTINLCGAGVAWFLANQFKRADLDLVTIGTITDLMPLAGVNRSLVYHGLEHLPKTKRLGLQELFKVAGINPEKIGTYEIGYIIGPRLNAAGRMEDPMDALRLLCTPKAEQALGLAKKLDQQNRQRKSLMEVMTFQAREMWLREDGKSNLIFVHHETWEHGIVGLVAGKLVEEFYRPAIVVAWGKQYSRASCRSINGFDIVEAIRTACLDLLEAHGGHPMAAGFTVETKFLEEVKKKLTEYANKNLEKDSLIPSLKIDMELPLKDLNYDLYEDIKKLEPFGLGNPEPVFVSKRVIVENLRTVGKENKHLALNLKSSSAETRMRAIGFNLGNLISKILPDKPIDVACNLVTDEWNGEKRLQLKLKDIQV